MKNIIAFKYGHGNPSVALREAQTLFSQVYRHAVTSYGRGFDLDKKEAETDVSSVLFQLLEDWKMTPEDPVESLRRWLRSFLWKRSIDLGRQLHRDSRVRALAANPAALDEIDDPPTRERNEFPNIDTDLLWRGIPKKGVMAHLLTYFIDPPHRKTNMTRAVTFVRRGLPTTPRRVIRRSAEELQERLRSTITTNYPELLGERGHPMATKKKAAAKRSTKATAKTEITDEAPKKAASKDKVPAKKAAKKAAKETTKKANVKTSNKEEIKKTTSVKTEEGSEEEGKTDLPEADVKKHVADINAAIAEMDAGETLTTWDIGVKLNDLHDKCSDPQFAAIVKEKVLGVDGTPKGKSWCYQALKMANTFDRDMANKMGIARCIQVNRLKTPEEKKHALGLIEGETGGIELDDGTTKMPWEMTVAELKMEISAYLEETYGKKKTPQEQVVGKLSSIQNGLNKFLETDGSALKKYKYAVEHVEFIESWKKGMIETIQGIEVTPTKEAQAILEAQAEKEEAGANAVS